MASGTARVRIGVNSPTGGVAFDAAPGKAWTLLKTGAANIIIKFANRAPLVEIYQAATGTPAETAAGLPCDWYDGSLSLAILAGNSVYYRAEQATQFTWMADA